MEKTGAAIQFKTILDNLTEGIVILDFDYHYLYVNEAALKQGRNPGKNFLGKHVLECNPGMEHTELFKAIEDAMKSRKPGRIEHQIIYPDGTAGWTEVSIQPVKEGLLTLSMDITEPRNAREKTLKEEVFALHADQIESFKEKNLQTLQSLRYAKRLQKALMQEKKDLNELFPGAFILLMPKHIVSGDFYWFKHAGDKVLIGAGDCTGHGVPGSLLSIMGLNILHAAFNSHKISSPPALLKYLDEDLNRKLSHKTTGKAINDGMDISICEIDRKKKTLTVSAANNPVYLVRNGELKQIKADKYSIGNGESGKEFGMQQVSLCKGDFIYLFSDGFMDQFGGPHGKKLGSVRFRELLSSVSKEDSRKQESLLQHRLQHWQGKEEQTDDILVIGVRID
ncbi:MAG: SpoIIE family protein phosphatase [Bacteroidia bacterium]